MFIDKKAQFQKSQCNIENIIRIAIDYFQVNQVSALTNPQELDMQLNKLITLNHTIQIISTWNISNAKYDLNNFWQIKYIFLVFLKIPSI